MKQRCLYYFIFIFVFNKRILTPICVGKLKKKVNNFNFEFFSHASTLKGGGDQIKLEKRVKCSNRMETKNNWRVLRLNSRYMFGKKVTIS